MIARRLGDEIAQELERFRGPRRAARVGIGAVLAATGDANLDDLWRRLAARGYPVRTDALNAQAVTGACPGEAARVLAAAGNVVERRVELLGSGTVELGRPIDWLTDFKTGRRWPPGFHRSIEYANLDEPSDVKVPWDLSRLQWAIPAGQAFLLTGEERYAEAVRDLLLEWIDENPYALTVNWTSTMEVALRILTWTWFFRVFHGSEAWSSADFRGRFLTMLYLHGDFTVRNLERSEVNGNHYTANAAGLVFAGLFFGRGRQPDDWQRQGWSILESQLPRQVTPDGVDFEASTAYHRLVLELFLLPALYRERLGSPTPAPYRERLEAMARFVAAYTRPDGSTPYWGDADDGRALPLGGQSVDDHRYLPALVGAIWGDDALLSTFPEPHPEVLWTLGPSERAGRAPADRAPVAFRDGGFYILQNEENHVFVDCGPVGLAGRGGHGHNDCMAFEAWLAGEPVLTDSGTYVYTASADWRDRFRSTAFHNTPQVDGEEQNRFVRPDWLWSLHDDATPEVRTWDPEGCRLVVSHSGYERLRQPVHAVRTVVLDSAGSRLVVEDRFEGGGQHELQIPYHLAVGVTAEPAETGVVNLGSPRQRFVLRYEEPDDWTVEIGDSWFSPSYGVKVSRRVVTFRRSGELRPLHVTIERENVKA